MGEEAKTLNKRLAKLLSTKTKFSYSDAISFIRNASASLTHKHHLLLWEDLEDTRLQSKTKITEDVDIDLIPSGHT